MPGPALPTRASQRATSISGLRSTEAKLSAILFSCDGVLVDSERDGHRVALNEAMKAKGFKKECSVDDYGKLLSARGEDRLTQYGSKAFDPFAIHLRAPSDSRQALHALLLLRASLGAMSCCM